MEYNLESKDSDRLDILEQLVKQNGYNKVLSKLNYLIRKNKNQNIPGLLEKIEGDKLKLKELHPGKKKAEKPKINKEDKPKKMKAVGSKAEVYHGNAKHTSGGLKKEDLMKNKHGKIVSKRKHANGLKNIDKLKPFQKTGAELQALRKK